MLYLYCPLFILFVLPLFFSLFNCLLNYFTVSLVWVHEVGFTPSSPHLTCPPSPCRPVSS